MKGRGVFAKKLIKNGELIMVEKSLTHLNYDVNKLDKGMKPEPEENAMLLKLVVLSGLLGIDAVRINKFYRGIDKDTIEIPSMSLYKYSSYKHYDIIKTNS